MMSEEKFFLYSKVIEISFFCYRSTPFTNQSADNQKPKYNYQKLKSGM